MFSQTVAWVLLTFVGLVLVGAWVFQQFGRRWLTDRRQSEAKHALRLFPLQREMLEAKFFDMARATGKPRGLKWLDCDWQHDVTFARACDTGLLTAFVAVNIRFEAIAGSDMEGVAAVDTIRDAAAVFQFQHDHWSTGGKALFNMNPAEALTRLAGQFEPVRVS